MGGTGAGARGPAAAAAIDRYEGLLGKDPRSRAFAPLAEAYRRLGLYDRAFEVLRRGVRHHPSWLPGFLGLARCYYDLGCYDSAHLALRPFVGGGGDNLALLRLLARTYGKLGMEEEAGEAWERLRFLSPRDREAGEGARARPPAEPPARPSGRPAFDPAPLSPAGAAGHRDDVDGWAPLGPAPGAEPPGAEPPGAEPPGARRERLRALLRALRERSAEKALAAGAGGG